MPKLPDNPRNILALLPNWLGDVAMCTPALRALRQRFPDAALHVAGKPAACLLLESIPWIGGLHPFPGRMGLPRMLRESRNLAPFARDICVIFPHAFRAAMLAWLSGSRCRVGYARGGRSLLLNQRIPPYREQGRIAPIYMAQEYLDLIAPLGCVDDDQGLELAADAQELSAVRANLDPNKPVVGIAPGAAFGPSKCWPATRYAQVADALTERYRAQCLLLTGPGEEDTRDAVLRTTQSAHFVPFQAETPSIARMKAAIACCDLFIGNDSGPRHVAIAFKKPVLCIMGSTSPRYTDSPWEQGEVLRVDVDCGPCQKPVCVTDHRCMTQITPDRVLAAAAPWLAPVTAPEPFNSAVS